MIKLSILSCIVTYVLVLYHELIVGEEVEDGEDGIVGDTLGWYPDTRSWVGEAISG